MDHDKLNGVCAVVVTYNRPLILKNCLSSLLTQVPYGLVHIHVVINSSDDETVGVIKSLDVTGDIISYSRYENEGPAGGFYYGLARFLEGSWRYAWLMDDDVMVDKTCLNELIKDTPNHSYIFPKVVKADGEEVVSFGWWAVLIARINIERAGLPLKELFYWAEDTEYLQNRLMRVYGIIPYRSATARVTHLHQRNEKRPSWYYYYTIRNTLYYRNYIAGYTWYRFKRTLFLFPQSMYAILTKEDNKITKLRLLCYGVYHGVMGKIGKVISPELYK